MSFSSQVKEELAGISRKDFTLKGKPSKMKKGLKIYSEAERRSWIRELFLQSGSISDPEKFYHLEIVFSEETEAKRLIHSLQSFSLNPKMVERKGSYVVYLKDGAQIADMLRIMEAGSSLMEFENIRIVKEMRNSINRQVNCEAANMGKTISAAVKQIEDINYLKAAMGFDQLTETLAETARKRLEYPEASLKELGEMMDPPIGKSGVNHRLKKLSELAEKMRSHKEEKHYD